MIIAFSDLCVCLELAALLTLLINDYANGYRILNGPTPEGIMFPEVIDRPVKGGVLRPPGR